MLYLERKLYLSPEKNASDHSLGVIGVFNQRLWHSLTVFARNHLDCSMKKISDGGRLKQADQ